LVDDTEMLAPVLGSSDDNDGDDSGDGAGRLPMVMFGLRAAALAGLAVAAGLGAGDIFFDLDTTGVTTTTCCITLS